MILYATQLDVGMRISIKNKCTLVLLASHWKVQTLFAREQVQLISVSLEQSDDEQVHLVN